MKRSFLFVVVVAAILSAPAAYLSAQEDGSGLLFTGCPPYVEGNHCDSMFYQVVAIDVGTGLKCPTAKYFLVSGPGEIDRKTGLWQFHPELEDLPSSYRATVEIAAYKGNDTTTSDENCQFEVRVYDRKPRLLGGCGAHLTVLPGETVEIPVVVSDADPCHEPELSYWEVHPEPVGPLSYDSVSMTFVFTPDPADSGLTYQVQYHGRSGPATFDCRFWLDCFEPELIKLRIETASTRNVQPWDTVSVDILVEECPVYLEQIDLTLLFDDDLMHYVGTLPGAPYFDSASGCGWRNLSVFDGYLCGNTGGRLLRLRATPGSTEPPGLPNPCRPSEQPAVLATLNFVVTGAIEPGEQFVPIDFYWCDCRSNLLWSPMHMAMFVASDVMSPEGRRIKPGDLPGRSGASNECFLDVLGPTERYRNVWYWNGGIALNFTEPEPESQYIVRVGQVEDQVQGELVELPITLEATDSSQGLGGFDLYVGYDASALALQSVDQGAIYDTCGWEYFTYRAGVPYWCGDACPSGLVRIIGVAETNNGPTYAGCDSPYPGHVQPGQVPISLATLRFLVSNDRDLAGGFVPVSFFWYDCTNNILSNHDGLQAYFSGRVFDINDSVISFPDDMPTWYGAADRCVAADSIYGHLVRRYVDYYNGGIGIKGADTVDMRGDINMNGIPWEIADAIMYQNYFLYGLSAFGSHVQGSIDDSDCNADGSTLTLSDYRFMMRVILGEVSPDPGQEGDCDEVALFLSPTRIDVNGIDSLGAVFFILTPEVHPTLLAPEVEMTYFIDNDTTRILIYSDERGRAIANGGLVSFEPAARIIALEAARFHGLTCSSGGPTDVSIEEEFHLPHSYSLGQNYPNPFNPSTTIEYDLPRAATVRLEVYNITGQRVRTLDYQGVSAGHHATVWDGRDESGRQVSSGVYLYRLTAGDFVETRKMMLLK